MAIPCCPAEGSVSTWTPENVLNKKLTFVGRVVILVFLLIRWVKSIVFGSWHLLLSVLIVASLSGVRGVTISAVLPVAELTSYNPVETVGIERTRNVGTIKPGKTTMLGEGEYPFTQNLLSKTLVANVTAVISLQSLHTIRTITAPLILNAYVKDATKYMHITVYETYLSFVTLQRYSQYPGKPGTSTLVYGEGAKALAATLGVTVDRAKELIENYFRPYPRVREFLDDLKRQAHEYSSVETLIGRPRRLTLMQSLGHIPWRQLPGKAKGEIAREERQAVNSPIQGGAADILKTAMILCEHSSELAELDAQMLLQVHDELIFEVPVGNAEIAVGLIKEIVEHPLPFELSVPLEVDISTGMSWSEAKG